MGTKIVVMKDGDIQQIDTPLGVYNHPANLFVAGFIGSPAMNFCRGAIRDGVFQSGRLSVPAPRELAQRFEGREVVLGVRPEGLQPALDQPDACDGVLVGQVELVEPMGAESHVHLRDSASVFVARVRPDLVWRLGDMVTFRFPASCAHFFDPASGAALMDRSIG